MHYYKFGIMIHETFLLLQNSLILYHKYIHKYGTCENMIYKK